VGEEVEHLKSLISTVHVNFCCKRLLFDNTSMRPVLTHGFFLFFIWLKKINIIIIVFE